jgi:peptide deformylase
MSQFKIVTGYKNPILRKKSQKIEIFNKEIKKLGQKMKNFLKQDNLGVGLASPQIGQNLQIIVAKLKENQIKIILNPKITNLSSEKTIEEEGCLSLPGVWGDVERFKKIKLDFQNLNGEKESLILEDFPARIIQHEYDHLQGILFLDKIKGKYRLSEKTVTDNLDLP